MNCNNCKGACIKKGFYKTTQRYQCKVCGRHQRQVYRNRKYCTTFDEQIAVLNKEGVGISSISRILSIPRASVQRRIERMKKDKPKPVFTETGQVYEVDELYTYIGRKSNPCYIMYAINRKTKQVIDFVCGARSRENISRLINTLLGLSPQRIYTDKLNVFGSVIPDFLHRTFQYRTNHIERKNLTLRTHLKRLSRKTICYSKSKDMLEACFRLYVWK
ncbi:IS1 family transposase [Pseudoflavitalea sp. X16]|uniref:IS1 family transposase n=1 Tax=Paraflavitalea devenefica TaxID=2716334 RepID=UPI00141DAF92|nr:IS1 family transposase [Paraflavitalea devenefica]NII26644.1 IS1 family transposase [Paraflavitalea devenefica]